MLGFKVRKVEKEKGEVAGTSTAETSSRSATWDATPPWCRVILSRKVIPSEWNMQIPNDKIKNRYNDGGAWGLIENFGEIGNAISERDLGCERTGELSKAWKGYIHRNLNIFFDIGVYPLSLVPPHAFCQSCISCSSILPWKLRALLAGEGDVWGNMLSWMEGLIKCVVLCFLWYCDMSGFADWMIKTRKTRRRVGRMLECVIY